MSQSVSERTRIKKWALNHLGNISIATIALILRTPPSLAVDSAEAASQVIATEGGQMAAKEAIDVVLKTARSTPSLSIATAIVCLACIPAAGVASSPGMCIACGILIAKTFG